jgi:hypothetical protein
MSCARGPWPPSLSSSNPVDLGSPLTNFGCSFSRGPPPHYPVISLLSLFLPAVDFFIQNLFRHTLIVHTVHLIPPADLWFDKSENVNMAQEGFNFVTWSQVSILHPARRVHWFFWPHFSQRLSRLVHLQFPGSNISALYITTVLINILYSVMLLLLQRRCDPCSFLRLKYAQFPAIILLVIFLIYLIFTAYISS